MAAPLLVELDGDEALVELAHRRLDNLLEHAVLLTGDLHHHRIVDWLHSPAFTQAWAWLTFAHNTHHHQGGGHLISLTFRYNAS